MGACNPFIKIRLAPIIVGLLLVGSIAAVFASDSVVHAQDAERAPDTMAARV
jgi:hypothetical protein